MNKLISLDDLKIYDREKNNHIGFDLYDEVSSDSGVFTITDAGDYNLRNLEIYEGNERIVSFTPEPFYNSAENYQVSVSGKNLFDATTATLVSGTTLNGQSFVTPTTALAGNKQLATADVTNIIKTYGTCYGSAVYSDNDLSVRININQDGTVKQRVNFPAKFDYQEGMEYKLIVLTKAGTATKVYNDTISVMIEAGEIATNYELYSGNVYTITPSDYEFVFDNIMTKSNTCNISIAKNNVGVKSTVTYRKKNEVNDVLQTIRNQRLPLGGESGQRLETNENGKMEWRNV